MAVRSEVTKNAAQEAAFEYEERRPSFTRKKAKGSSIIEMLVAIFVLGIVLISMVGMFLISRTAIYNKEDETANAIALRYLEEEEARPFTDFAAFPTHPASYGSKQFGKFDARAYVMGAPTDYMAKVRVDVAWQGAAMGARTLTLERTISAGGHKNVGEHN
ncbi:MAG: prepilin-type N-terminal cleavage/methylation domain-containing protein [Synergistaceae bacterium]|nr:prepilin-type N-terminal cleavage/methylation domain-containing protein [Synergistaceae bacterium]